MPQPSLWENKKILYIGSTDPQSNSFRRYRSLQELGLEVHAVNIDEFIYHSSFSSLHHRLNFGPGIFKLNRSVREAARKFVPDLVWVDNKPFITAKTILYSRQILPNVKWINLVTDDPTGRYKKAWRLFKSTASLYDMHFVQRIENIEEVKAYAAKRVELCFRSYDPFFHQPIQPDDADLAKYKAQVGFIGTYEQERENSIACLIEQGIAVQVTGDGWPKGKHWEKIKPYYTGPSVYGNEYVKRLNAMGIALHFLRHANRDGQDSRTFEIPACRVFMIAERSKLHEQFFAEDKEAVFFDNNEELVNKVKFYIDQPELRYRIAEEGFRRCTQSGYSHKARLTEVLNKIYEPGR